MNVLIVTSIDTHLIPAIIEATQRHLSLMEHQGHLTVSVVTEDPLELSCVPLLLRYFDHLSVTINWTPRLNPKDLVVFDWIIVPFSHDPIWNHLAPMHGPRMCTCSEDFSFVFTQVVSVDHRERLAQEAAQTNRHGKLRVCVDADIVTQSFIDQMEEQVDIHFYLFREYSSLTFRTSTSMWEATEEKRRVILSGADFCVMSKENVALSCLTVAITPGQNFPSSVGRPQWEVLWAQREKLLEVNQQCVFRMLPSVCELNPFNVRRVHHVWISKNKLNSMNYPVRYDGNLAAWKQMNPEMEHTLWLESDIEKLIEEHYDYNTMVTFRTLCPHIARCDFARLLVVHALGGLYCDMDFVPTKPVRLWPAIQEESGMLLFNEIGEHFKRGQISNGIFAATQPHHLFLHKLITEISRNRKAFHHNDNVLQMCGPILWYNTWQEYFPEMTVQDGWQVMPFNNKSEATIDFVGDRACWCYTVWDQSTGWQRMFEGPQQNFLIESAEEPEVDNTFEILFIVFTVLLVLEILYLLIRLKRVVSRPLTPTRTQLDPV